jgi:hypothetical protein
MFLTRLTDAFRRTTTPRARQQAPTRRFRPLLENLEDRAVPAQLLNITDVDLSGLSIADGVLTAAEGTVTGTLAGHSFTTNITDFALNLIPDDPATSAEECSVLHLELAPIDIDLLGLHVDTSAICLDVTATEDGGILGDLLCGLADGLPLGNLPILGGATGLNNVVESILGGVLGGGLKSAGDPPAGAEDICDGECEILDLALGPVDLSLLGLNVSLDNCEDGPVQVCVSASEGEGLLGDLLCGLTGDGALPDLPAVPNLNLTQKDVDKIVKQAEKLTADGELSLKDVTKLVDQFERLTRR